MDGVTPNSDGPDVSRWNPVADWDAIPQYRLFVTKATGTSRIDDIAHVDPTFDSNWRAMKAKEYEFRGAYHWLRPDIPMADQVALLHRALSAHGGLQPGEFIMLDWERSPGLPIPSVAQVEEWIRRAWVYWPGRIALYGAEWVTGFAEWRAAYPGFPLFYAAYNLTTAPAKLAQWNADVWQWTSSHAIPGIDDPTCDMNHVINWATLETITGRTMKLPIVPVVMPSDLSGVTNGKLPDSILRTVVGGGRLHHLAARAWGAMTEAAWVEAQLPFTYTHGGAYRTYQQQETLFRSRYVPGGSGGGCKVWNGQQWCKKSANLATAAVPGTSNHGWGLAVDMALDSDLSDGLGPDDAVSLPARGVTWMITNAARFGFSAELQSESWHWRYVTGDAVPAAVLTYEQGSVVPPVTPPPVHPTTKAVPDMLILDLNPGTAWWTAMQLAGDELTHLVNGHHVTVLERGGVPRVPVNETELAGILTSTVTTNASPFAPGLPAFNQALHDAWLAAA